MGVIERLFTLVFGGGRNVVKDTVEVFRENAEAGRVRAMRDHKAEASRNTVRSSPHRRAAGSTGSWMG